MRMLYSFSYFVLLLLAVSSIQASPATLVLIGRSKLAHLSDFLDEIPENHPITPDDKTLILTRQSVEIFNNDGFETISDLKFAATKNFSTIILTNEQDLDNIIRTQRSLKVLDFDKSTQVSKLLFNCATSIESQNYNTFICENSNFIADQPTIGHFSFFASAAKSDKKSKKVVKVESVEEDDDDEDDLEEEIQVIVEKKMKEVEKRKKEKEEDDDDDDDDENEFDNKHDPKRDHRLHCKYRKTCYKTGKRGIIEPFDFSFDHIFHFWRAPPSQQHHHLSKHEDADQDGIRDSEDDDVSLADRKLVCKYRTACYKDHDIPLTDKQQERERSFISAKLQVPHGKKRTLKDIATKAIDELEEREEQVKHRPIPKSMVVEKKLKEIEDHLQKKLDCKYRKSCYETGQLPEIDETISIPFLSTFSASASASNADDDEEAKPFEEMEDLERKHYCKYRKSCYETGKVPDIESEIQVESIRDIFDVAEQVETRKLTLQERCKYRKSCYETGILPDLSRDEEHIEKVANKEVSAVVPSTLNDLKTLCKYRKSCYQEIAVADSSNDVVETIRKRRIIEKEVRKRRTRRQRHMNKKKAMMARYGLRTVYDPVEKTQDELKKLADKREIRKQAPPPKVIKREIKKKESVKKTRSRAAEVVEDIAEAVVAQKIAEALSEQEDDDNSDEVIETPPEKSSKSKKIEEEEKPKTKKSVKKIEKEPEVKKVVKKVEAVVKDDPEEDESPEAADSEEKEPEVKKSQKSKKSPVKKIEDSEEDEDEKPAQDSEESKSDEKKKPSKKVDKPVVKVVPVPVQKSKKSPVKKIEDSEEEEETPAVKKVVKQAETSKDDSEEDEVKEKKKPAVKVVPDDSEEEDEKPAVKKIVKKVKTSKDDSDEVEEVKKTPVKKEVKAKIAKQAEVKKSAEEDDGNEFDNKHDPKRDHRLHCKYRKTCYETGKRGLIEPFDFSFDHLFHLWRAPLTQQHHNYGRDSDGDGIPDSEDQDTHISHRKLACKYKPSCYEKFDIPVSENIVEREQKRSSKSETVKKSKDSDDDDDDDDDDDSNEISKSDKKLSCKYRKSCYDSGVLPKIQEWNNSPKNTAPTKKSDDDDDDDEEISKTDKKLECKYRKSCYDSGVLPTIQQWSVEPQLVDTPLSSAKDHKLQKCKYRKSCYEEMGIHEKDEEETKIVEKEEERKPQLKKQPAIAATKLHGGKEHKEKQQHQQKHQKKVDSEEDDGDDDDSGEKDDNDDDDEVKIVKKVLKEVERQDDVNDMETEIAREIHLSNQDKYICKYRKSCYSTVEPKAAKQDHSGNMARRAGSGEKCHIYYLSCREQMGLPPKEKAPMGRNGKKLCRKVKK